jgi:hypothetical protein
VLLVHAAAAMATQAKMVEKRVDLIIGASPS